MSFQVKHTLLSIIINVKIPLKNKKIPKIDTHLFCFSGHKTQIKLRFFLLKDFCNLLNLVLSY